LLSSPLRSRFSGGTFRLDFYHEEEVREILKRSASILGLDIPEQALIEIAERSRFTPRIANYLLKRCRDYAQVHKIKISKESVAGALALLDIDTLGLQATDRVLLDIIIKRFSGGPVGLSTLAAATAEESATIEEVHEPYLLRCGLLKRTPRGRVATRQAYEHLGISLPTNYQEKLL